MPEFTDTLSPVQLVTQERTPSAAPLIAQTAATLLNVGAVVKDKVDLSGFRKEIAVGQEDLDTASQELDTVATENLDGLQASMATHVRAVEQGVRTRDQAAIAINSMFKGFIAEHPHLAKEARQVVSTTGGSSSLGGSIGGRGTGMSLEERNARDRATSIRNIQQTTGGTLEQASNQFMQLEQAKVKLDLEPLNAADFTTNNNNVLFASTANTTSKLMNDARAIMVGGDLSQLPTLKNRALAESAMGRNAAKQAVNTSAQQMRARGNHLSQATIESQIATVDAAFDDLDNILNMDMFDAVKILEERAAFVGNRSNAGMNTYNKLLTTQANLAKDRGDIRLSNRALSVLADTPSAFNRNLDAFGAAENILLRVSKEGVTLRKALKDLSVTMEARSDIERRVSLLQEMDAPDIWSFLMRGSQARAESPKPAKADPVDDIDNAETHKVLVPKGAKTGLAVPHTLNSVANPQKYILSGSFFDMYTTSLEADQGEAMLNMADNFTASALANITGLDKKVSQQGLPTSSLVINPNVFSEGNMLVPRPIKPTKNVSIPAIPFIRRDIDLSTVNPALAVAGGRSSLRLEGIQGAAQLLDDNITRINYLLTFTMAQYGPESKEFKDLFSRVTATVKPKQGKAAPKKIVNTSVKEDIGGLKEAPLPDSNEWVARVALATNEELDFLLTKAKPGGKVMAAVMAEAKSREKKVEE